MLNFQIRRCGSTAVLFEGKFLSLRACVETAAQCSADLSGADLSGADLSGANLSGAYLSGADLSGANFSGANLSGAYLSGADLSGADLSGANLSGAYLSGADLSGADLSSANLSGATLSGANFSGATLCDNCKATAAPVRRAIRSDGYEFLLWPTDKGWRVGAGCWWFTLNEAWLHWEQARGGTPLGEESLDILTMFQLYVDREGGEP